MEAFQQIDASKRKSALRDAFTKHSRLPQGDEAEAVDVNGLLEMLRAVGLMHEICAAEVEAFVRAEVPAGAWLAYSPDVEAAFDKAIAFEHGHGMSSLERRGRFPKANALVDEASGTTALRRAVEDGDLALTEKLLLLGADPERAALDGSAPLFVACMRGSTEIVRALSFCGANAHAAVNQMGETPLHVACHHGHAECVDELCLSGADPNRPQRDGATGLHAAAKAVRRGRFEPAPWAIERPRLSMGPSWPWDPRETSA